MDMRSQVCLFINNPTHGDVAELANNPRPESLLAVSPQKSARRWNPWTLPNTLVVLHKKVGLKSGILQP